MASGRSTTQANDILKNQLHFPSFNDLGHENDLDERYWEEDPWRGVWVKACTWCFLGEITYDEYSQIPFWRNRVHVRDRRGKDDIPVLFYPDSGFFFDFKTLKKGHTICVMLAEQHYFLDTTIGLRIENLDLVKVIPCSLEDLFAISAVHSHQNACWTCGKTAGGDGEAATVAAMDLKRCAACHTAKYCCKQCQVSDWKERHRRWCKAMPEFNRLVKIDYSTYNEDALFGLLGRIW